MNITTLLHKISDIAESVVTVRSSYIGDCYTIWNTNEVEYSSFVVNIRNVSRDDNLRVYNVVLYYGDRLLQDGSNRLGVWDDAVNSIQTVISKLNEEEDVEVVEEYAIELFEQKFTDMLAGGFVILNIQAADELSDCGLDEIEEEEPNIPDPYPFNPEHPIVDPDDFPYPGGGGEIPIH